MPLADSAWLHDTDPHSAGAHGRELVSGPVDPADAAVEAAMQARKIPLDVGMFPSMWDIFRDLVFTMSITCGAFGVLNLMLGAFTLLSLAYRIPPPLISGVLIELVVLASLTGTYRIPSATNKLE